MKEIRALTGVRGIAALWVLFCHFGSELSTLLPDFELLKPVYSRGGIGVDLFFILSGFIITYVYSSVAEWDRKNNIGFVIKRFSRIYPVHLVTLLCLCLLVVVSSLTGTKLSGNYSIQEFFYHICLLQGFPISTPSWNYPSWSISAEFFGYFVIFPFTVILFRKRFWRCYSLWLSFLFIIVYILLKGTYGFGSWGNIVRISLEFASGAALYHGLVNTPLIARFMSRSIPFALLISLIVCFLPETVISNSCEIGVLIFTCFIVIAGLSTDEGFVCRFLGRRPLRYLGLISYSLYMSHAIVEKVFKVVFPASQYSEVSVAIRSLVFVVHIFVPIFVAACLYHCCEEPARKYIQRRTKHWTQRATVRESL